MLEISKLVIDVVTQAWVKTQIMNVLCIGNVVKGDYRFFIKITEHRVLK